MKEVVISNIIERFERGDAPLRQIIVEELSQYDLMANSYQGDSDIQHYIDFFLNIKKLEGLLPRTLVRYKYELGMLARCIRKPVSAITINDLRGFLADAQAEKTLAKTTINNKIGALRSFFQTLYREEIIAKDPSIKLVNLKVDLKSLRNPLDAEELERLRNVCVTPKEKAFVEFLFSTGCRISEVVEATRSKINWQECSLIVHGKGDKYRKVFFNVKCKLYLMDYFAKRKGEADAIFLGDRYPHNPMTKSGLEKFMKKIAKKAGIEKKITPHVLRHSFGTNMLNRGTDITVISEMLGHANLSTTQIYAKLNDDTLKSAYNKAM